jgi:hypothetical protein
MSLFALLLATAMPSVAHATNSCPSWYDPWDKNVSNSYGPITLQPNGGTSLSSNITVVLEFWGASYNHSDSRWTGNDLNILNKVPTMLATNEFWSRYSQYGVTGGTISGTPIYDFGATYNATLSDDWIKAEVANEIAAGTVPYGSNYIYLIFLPDDLEATSASSSKCTGPTAPGSSNPSCPGSGFHRYTIASQGLITVGVVQEAKSSATCNQACVDGANSITAAHEVMEAATDPDQVHGYSSPIPQNAPVVNNSTLEIGDLCNGLGEQVNGVWWQQSWLQDQCRCDGQGTPGVFFDTNFNYTGSPIGDWAGGSYKAQCSPGQPVVGLSQGTTSGTFAPHAALCGNGPDYNVKYPQSSCRSVLFDDGSVNFPQNNPVPWTGNDWAPNYYKAQCNSNEYVAGVSQSSIWAPSGVANQLDGILCCAGSVTQKSCTAEVLFAQNSPDFHPPDWDNGYYKAMCPQGKYVAGVSAFVNNEFVPNGAAYSVLCCSP